MANRPGTTVRVQISRWRGIATGWQPIGRPRTAEDADRLQALIARVLPEIVTRVTLAEG